MLMKSGDSRAAASVLALMCAIALCFCRSGDSDGESGLSSRAIRGGDAVVLVVELASYSLSDFLRYVTLTTGEEAGNLTEAVLSRMFDSYVEDKLLLAEARTRNISLEGDEPKGDEGVKDESGAAGAASGLEDDEMMQLQSDRLLIKKWTGLLVAGLAADPEEIASYYSEKKREFLKPARVSVSQILLATQEKAIQALDMVKDASNSRFREVARLMSVGVEADKGGAMGVFELGQLPSEMESVIFALQEGEVSQVVESSYGFHIFRVDKKFAPELISEEEATREIKSRIRDRKIQDHLSAHIAELKERMNWTSYTQNLSFTYVRNGNE